MEQRIGLFSDAACTGLREYHAADVAGLLSGHGLSWREVDAGGLSRLSRRTLDTLIFPYVDGELPPSALRGLVRFHEAGGSLLVLGDLPHAGRWYPLRNSHAWRLHLTRCYDDESICADKPGIAGLTAKGREILGRLEAPEFYRDKHFAALRVTAFPPDETHPLLHVNSSSHTNLSTAVVAVERRCRRFFGAKFAMVGYNGGEPRENVLGSYRRPWAYDPGLLTREWPGIGPLVMGLLRWVAPADLASSIEVAPVCREGEEKPPAVVLRNLSGQPQTWRKPRLSAAGRTLGSWPDATLAPGEVRELRAARAVRGEGIHPLTLTCGREPCATATARIFPADAARHDCFGFSTYWAFQEPKVCDEFRHFCREMAARGCQYVRVNIPWEDVEPEPGRHDWRVTDQLLAFAAEADLRLQFWLFPTTLGSGLADAGVPSWTLREPALDRDGKPGNFPTIWSPFYRQHYFAMVAAMARRYGRHPRLDRFIIDFGNSDFPYGYYYYVNDTSLFDYSPQEQAAFARWLRTELDGELASASRLFGREFRSFEEVPVPRIEQAEAWRLYLDFRGWSVYEGIRQVNALVREIAPAKLPPDLPGHGLGSIADASTYFFSVKARHWQEERKFDPRHIDMHNAGPTWGGEAWQVGGYYRQYDEALFQSVRLGATYHSIPGADLGTIGEDIARIGLIRRTLAGATRAEPEVAVLDRTGWHDHRSLANLAPRLDVPVDLLCAKHRFDFSCYRLLALPDRDIVGRTATGGGGGSFLPTDEGWYWLLRESVEKGLTLLVFPQTCELRQDGLQRTFLRQVLGLEDVAYGPRRKRLLRFPRSFGGGTMPGAACEVRVDGEVLVRDGDGRAMLVRRPHGKGAVLLAGWDNQPGGPDAALDPERCARIPDHTFLRLCRHLGIGPRVLRTNRLFAWKELVHLNGRHYLLLYSHFEETLTEAVTVWLPRPVATALDLATGEAFPLSPPGRDGGQSLRIRLHPRQGRYLALRHDPR